VGFETEVANLDSKGHTDYSVDAQAEVERDSGVCSSSSSRQAKRIHSNSSNRFDGDVNDAGLAFERVCESRDKLEIRSDTGPLRAGESGLENPDRVCDPDRPHVRVRNHLSLDLGGLDHDNSDNHIHAHLVQNLCPDPILHCIVDFSRTVHVHECLGVQHSDSVRGVRLDYSCFDSVHQVCEVSLYALLLTPGPNL